MNEVRANIDIAASPEHVWEVVMDPERLGDWVTIHRGLGRHDHGPARRGYEMEQTLCLRGVNFKVRWELVSLTEGRHAEWHGRGPARSHAETEYQLAAMDGGTRFSYRNVFNPPLGPIGRMASRALVGGLPTREAHASLSRLKALAERGLKS